jgi:hypothetical protein
VLIAVLAGVVAVAAAIRSTWSPCGQSMLSTITPMGEASAATASGRPRHGSSSATLGGVGLGAGRGAPRSWAVGLSETKRSLVVALCVLAAAADAQLFGLRIPYHRRQVNELWLDDYRSWVYSAGFGFQIRLGLATYIMSSAVVLLVALAAR